MKTPGKLDEIIRLSSELNTVQDLDMLLDKILTEARKILSADAASIQIKENNELVFSHVQTESIQRKLPPGQKLIYKTFRTKISNKSLSGYAALSGEILNIQDVYLLPESAPYKFDSSNDKKSNYRTKSMLTIPLKNNRGDSLGVMQIINALKSSQGDPYLDASESEIGYFDSDDELIALHFANIASMVLERAQMTRALILRMISMAELRDPKETGPHVNRVASYSVELFERWAARHNMPQIEVDRRKDILRMAAMLHDVGKVAISDLILKKPAKFTESEYEIMKSHTYLGARLFKDKQSEFDEVAAMVAMTHHENWDGTGYPGHVDAGDLGETPKIEAAEKPVTLKGEEISIYGRIVSIADVYDALSSKRVYKEVWDEASVLEEIKKSSGSKFDPELVEIFFEAYDVIKSISGKYPDH
jgi:HD-GYP domain-containing protein (c-di-GMP phosphodiesterase class II)